MKRFLFAIILVTITFALQAQKPFVIFGHATKNPFQTEQTADRNTRLNNGICLWSFDAVVSGFEITFNGDESYFEKRLLSGAGGAIGYRFYKPNGAGEPVTKWGINLALMTKVDVLDATVGGTKLALLPNYYNLMAGPCWTFEDKKLSFIIGANIQF